MKGNSIEHTSYIIFDSSKTQYPAHNSSIYSNNFPRYVVWPKTYVIFHKFKSYFQVDKNSDISIFGQAPHPQTCLYNTCTLPWAKSHSWERGTESLSSNMITGYKSSWHVYEIYLQAIPFLITDENDWFLHNQQCTIVKWPKLKYNESFWLTGLAWSGKFGKAGHTSSNNKKHWFKQKYYR